MGYVHTQKIFNVMLTVLVLINITTIPIAVSAGDDLSVGRKVTVYYDDFGSKNEFYQALKVEVQR